jgi:hypothetical protein
VRDKTVTKIKLARRRDTKNEEKGERLNAEVTETRAQRSRRFGECEKAQYEK